VAKDGAPSARLEIAGRDVLLTPGANLLGRLPEAALRIESGAVSRRHAIVTVTDGGASIEDLASKNGTFVNGERVRGVRPLSDGDEIRLGPVRLVFRLPPRPRPPRARRADRLSFTGTGLTAARTRLTVSTIDDRSGRSPAIQIPPILPGRRARYRPSNAVPEICPLLVDADSPPAARPARVGRISP
jgi:hypothetical protein